MKQADIEALMTTAIRLTNRVNENVDLKQYKPDSLKDYTELLTINTGNVLESAIERKVELCKNN